MPTPKNKDLYGQVKLEASKIYSKPSAYKSGWIVQRYKQLGGKYIEDNKPANLKRWFDEKWSDIGNESYPVYRPSVRVNKNTPLLPSEIDPINLKQQIMRKQVIRGKRNLKPFKSKPDS